MARERLPASYTKKEAYNHRGVMPTIGLYIKKINVLRYDAIFPEWQKDDDYKIRNDDQIAPPNHMKIRAVIIISLKKAKRKIYLIWKKFSE